MPPKITPKNLHYDTTLPPFLQKLQGNYDRGVSDRDGRHEPALLRGRAKRARSEDGEDDPVYVDEEGNVVDAKLVNGITDEETGENKGSGTGDDLSTLVEKQESERAQAKEKEAVIGGIKKKKVGRVVGSASPPPTDKSVNAKEEEKELLQQSQASTTETKTTSAISKTAETSNQKLASDSSSKPGIKKKKPLDKLKKKIKLSFGDDE